MFTCFPNNLIPAVLVSLLLLCGFKGVRHCHAAEKPKYSPKETFFVEQVAPIFEMNCLRCHSGKKAKGAFSLETRDRAMRGGDSGQVIIEDSAEESLVIEMITGKKPSMPAKSKPLHGDQIKIIEKWIDDGAAWPFGFKLKERVLKKTGWWSLQPLKKPALPKVSPKDAAWCNSPIDRFIIAKLREKGLAPSAKADRRTLIRRLYYDLIGLPPTPAQVNAFVNDKRPDSYAKLVDELLASKHYGERWARHWLDVVHYGDTHGYDKDKPRMNAWPYRDYVIRSFNEDKPFTRFVQEQIAGDVLWPGTVDGTVAMGFLAAGPWDFIGHAEVPESKIDGKVARHMDRDDMVRVVMETFNSMTVGCAQCHHHKFDPVTMEDYYSLQAVFASLDRADRVYDSTPAQAESRARITSRISELKNQLTGIEKKEKTLVGNKLKPLDVKIATLAKQQNPGKKHPAFGYHSKIVQQQKETKWVQVDLGKAIDIAKITYVGCWDDFNNIYAGFGFPVRYQIKVSNDATFKRGVVVVNHTNADVPNPGIAPQSVELKGKTARYVRITATKLAPRKNDYIFALAELSVFDRQDRNVAKGKKVTALDSIEAPVRWAQKNLVDGIFRQGKADPKAAKQLELLRKQREQIIVNALGKELPIQKTALKQQLAIVNADLAKLPKKNLVYVAKIHKGSGNFRGRAGLGPRAIHVLARGQVTQPGAVAPPGTVDIIQGVNARFELDAKHEEGQRRISLAKWLTRKDHPLTWRSIVNRVWLNHVGKGIVDTPNDFGVMGQLPTHPQLLEWLAVEFRDGGQSFKKLHRLICNSSFYKQSSGKGDQGSAMKQLAVDASNRFLWRMNRRQLDAEAVRDSTLVLAGKMDQKMGGPAFRDFAIVKPTHSPHYEYDRYDPDSPETHRRSIYRFIVRSQPQPFMDVLGCADPSLLVGKRHQSMSVLQALAMLNNRFMLRMCEHMASRLQATHKTSQAQVKAAVEMVLLRSPDEKELASLTSYASETGLANVCRVLLNLNEFVFID